MKIFLDTADTSIITKHFATGLIDGITTNPTLIKKSGRDPLEVYQELKDLGIKDISMEVVGTADEMIKEGAGLHDTFGDCCTVKVPCSPDGLRACKELSDLNVRVNVTLIFSQTQAILASKAGAKYVSPFVGRVDDNSFGGICLVKDIVNVFKEHFVTTNVLAASIRNVRDVGRLFEHGAEIVTMPPAVFEKMYNHILTDKGLELFQADWESVTHNS
jgi:transaldolase